MPDSPSFTDGRRSLKDPVVENLNVLISTVPLRYHYIDDSFAEGGRTIDHELEGEGDHLGSDTKASGCDKGAMNLQLDKATDAPPRPAHVLKVTKGSVIKYYVVEPPGPKPMGRNNVVRVSPTLKQIVNPFFQGLLSEVEGDTKRHTHSKAGGNEDITTNPVNHRTGSTKAYSATQEDGTALPAGVAINSSTGVITITAATVSTGVYTIKVVASDTLAPYRTLEGEATLVLTVTA